jgi:threonine dehydrogenase-like Zn-dependent dehydrogenase
MKAAVVERPGVLKIKDIPEPKVGEHDLLVKVRTASICNATDNHIFNGTFRGPHDFYPQVLGHEVHGEVVACGPGVDDAPIGKRVVFYTPRGAFCEYTTLDTSALPWACVSDNLSDAESPLCEMFHGAFLHTVYPSGLKEGEKVAVIGQGPLGLVVSQCLKATADCTLGVVDFQAFRLTKAKELGADRIYNRSELSASGIASRMKDEIGLVDLAVVCTDINLSDEEDVYEFAIRLLRPRGRLTGLTVAVKGLGHRVDVGRLFEKHILFRRRLNEVYSTDPAEKVAQERKVFQLGADWVAAGKINLRAMVTHRIPMEDIEHGLYLCRKKPDETIKVVVEIANH